LHGLELVGGRRPKAAAKIVTGGGTRIYLLPVESFPNHHNNVYYIDDDRHPTLFDVGTAQAHEQLVARFEEIRARFGVKKNLVDLREAVVSHAHIDHFGNAHTIRDLGVPITIHEQDARVLGCFEERRVLVTRDIEIFLRRAGLEQQRVSELTSLYGSGKRLFKDLAPDRTLRDGDTIGPGWRVIHVPGHCAGMIALAVDDVVLTADHLLARITPAQFPEWITPFTGLEHFLRSLDRLEHEGPFALGLGAHEAPMTNVSARIEETRRHHVSRLERVRDLCAGRTVAELACELFGDQLGYGAILAISETGAHLEFLHDHGYVEIANIDDVASRYDAAARFRATSRVLDPHDYLPAWPYRSG
jgi:glyoxylase-like metal-dependent hydrolase (beta-lactamase superfamily II)